MDAFHAGELAVQERAGARDQARAVARGFRTEMPDAARAFLAEQVLAVVAAADAEGRPWAVLRTGEPGFLRALDARTLALDAQPPAGDPLAEAFVEERAAGVLVIDLATRRRMRAHGAALAQRGGGLRLGVEQVYSNCPKYVQARDARRAADGPAPGAGGARRSHALDEAQRRWIAAADTFFIATRHPVAGADASHRGGEPGFVRVAGERLTWRDYPGNGLFQTLGNLQVDPRAGLVFPDFDAGHALHVSGAARVLWDDRTGERSVQLDVERVVQIQDATPLRFRLRERSPFNPPEAAQERAGRDDG